jgi:uncharacterized protein
MPHYDFTQFSELPDDLHWFNKPASYNLDSNGLALSTKPETDFWQGTHYGFRRDDGHCLLTPVKGDFSLTTEVSFIPEAQYDQCGLFLRMNSKNWIKVSTEYENPEMSRLGSVVTNLGYSDWATQDVSADQLHIHYRIQRTSQDFFIEQSPDGKNWIQIRVTRLHDAPETLDIGIYACSPVGKGFTATFKEIEIGESAWR